MEKQTKIWVLFSIANMYDQPEANLEAWWFKKPSLKLIIAIVGFEDRKRWIGILSGKEVRVGEADYRLRHIKEGVYKS